MFSLQKRCLAGSLHNRYFNYKEKIINIRFTGTKNPAPLFIKIPVCHPPLRTTKKQPETGKTRNNYQTDKQPIKMSVRHSQSKNHRTGKSDALKRQKGMKKTGKSWKIPN